MMPTDASTACAAASAPASMLTVMVVLLQTLLIETLSSRLVMMRVRLMMMRVRTRRSMRMLIFDDYSVKHHCQIASCFTCCDAPPP